MQRAVGTNLDAAAAADAPVIVEFKRPGGFVDGPGRADCPAGPALSAEIGIDDGVWGRK
nr:hypothetical protein [Syntrophus aciditrophicus]